MIDDGNDDNDDGEEAIISVKVSCTICLKYKITNTLNNYLVIILLFNKLNNYKACI